MRNVKVTIPFRTVNMNVENFGCLPPVPVDLSLVLPVCLFPNLRSQHGQGACTDHEKCQPKG